MRAAVVIIGRSIHAWYVRLWTRGARPRVNSRLSRLPGEQWADVLLPQSSTLFQCIVRNKIQFHKALVRAIMKQEPRKRGVLCIYKLVPVVLDILRLVNQASRGSATYN